MFARRVVAVQGASLQVDLGIHGATVPNMKQPKTATRYPRVRSRILRRGAVHSYRLAHCSDAAFCANRHEARAAIIAGKVVEQPNGIADVKLAVVVGAPVGV